MFIFCIQQSDRLSQCNHLGLLPLCVAIDPNIGNFNDRFCVRSLSPPGYFSRNHSTSTCFHKGISSASTDSTGPRKYLGIRSPKHFVLAHAETRKKCGRFMVEEGPKFAPTWAKPVLEAVAPESLGYLEWGVPWRGKKVGWKVELVGIGGRIFMELSVLWRVWGAYRALKPNRLGGLGFWKHWFQWTQTLWMDVGDGPKGWPFVCKLVRKVQSWRPKISKILIVPWPLGQEISSPSENHKTH